jgi:WD40 repeat protein
MGKNQGAFVAHRVWCVPSLSVIANMLIQVNGNSVNSVSWAPHELGAILACASSDGKISVLTFKGVVLHHPAAPPTAKKIPSLYILTRLNA